VDLPQSLARRDEQGDAAVTGRFRLRHDFPWIRYDNADCRPYAFTPTATRLLTRPMISARTSFSATIIAPSCGAPVRYGRAPAQAPVRRNE
jgi:hypothetical protein